MSTGGIAARTNPERTNRWLLIGAVALAVLAGILVFAALANVGSDDGSAPAATEGPNAVLVANQTIAPGTQLTSDMFDVASFEQQYLVTGAIADPDAIVGRRTLVEVLQGQQLSSNMLTEGTRSDYLQQLAFKIPEGMRGYSFSVNESTAVGGLLTPGDRIDLIVEYVVRPNPEVQEVEFLRVEVLAQNVEILARAQEDVESVAVLGPDGTLIERETDTGIERRPSDLEPNPGASTVTIALTPQQVMELTRFLGTDRATIRISLRPFGDDSPTLVEPVEIRVFR